MKRKLVFLVGCFAICANAFSADPIKTPDLKEANALYEAGKFSEAAIAYGAIADEKKGGAAVFYNLANAELRAGNKGKARLGYERALKIDARDPDVQWNLQVLKNSLSDRIEPPSDPLAVEPLLKILTELFTIDEASRAVMSMLAFLAVLSFLSWKAPAVRNLTRVFRTLFLFSLAVTVFLFTVKWMQVKDPSAIVLTKEVTARYGPTIKETKAFVLHEGARVRILDETKDWFYARLDDGKEGWLPKNSCEII